MNYGENYGDEIEWRNKLARQGITFGARHSGAMPWETFQSDLVDDRVADALISEDDLMAVLEKEYPELPGALVALGAIIGARCAINSSTTLRFSGAIRR